MNEIRVNSGIVVKVNDNGDTITINAEDQCFIEKFYGLYDRLNNLSVEMQGSEVQKKGEREQLQYMIEKTREIMQDIDSLFGENACKKVFGDIVPNPSLLVDFFEQLNPIAKQYVNERQKKLDEKYNNDRKGARSKPKNRNKYRSRKEIIQDSKR